MTRHVSGAARWCAAVAMIVAAVLATGSFGICLQAQEPAPPDAEVDTAPVEIDGHVLFRVRGASSFVASTRADAIRGRIEAIASDRTIDVTSIGLAQSDSITWIKAGDRPIMGIVEADARLEQLSRSELASAHLARIRQAVAEYRRERTPESRGQQIRDVVVAAALLVATVSVVLLLTGWLRRMTRRVISRRIEWTSIQSIPLVRVERLMALVSQLLNVIAGVVLIALTFQFVSYALGRFPNTRGMSNRLLAMIVEPLTAMGQGAVRQLPNIAVLVVLFLIFRIVLRTIRLIFVGVERGAINFAGFDAEWALPTYNIVRFLIIAFGLVVAYPYMPGSESAAFKGVSLFIGVLFSLGSSSAVSNLIAGYMLIYRRAFRVGDRVKIGDVIGEVIDSRVQVTRLRTPKNEVVIIPNSQILGGDVTNYTALAGTQGLILYTTVGIGYETPWRQVEAMLLAAAERTPGIRESPKPFVLQKALGDFAVTYELNVYCAETNRIPQVYTDLHRHILDVFNEYGVQIMTPAYEGDPTEPKIVPPSNWFASPANRAGGEGPSAVTAGAQSHGGAVSPDDRPV
jgi:small-conductance mechanosensitive channel